MCDLCLHFPHLPGCPNGPDPVTIHTCVTCGTVIMEGERFWDSLEGAVCEDCIRNMSALDFMEMVDEHLTTAVKEYDY